MSLETTPTTPTASAAVPSRSDRIGLIATIAFGILGIGFTIYQLVVRLIEIIPNRDVPVLVPFIDTPAKLPLGPDGSTVTVDVDRATVLVSDLPAITVASLIIGAVVTAASIVAVILIVCLLCRRLIAGETFSVRNTRLISGIAGTIIGGWFLGTLFGNMGVNGAFSRLSEYTYDGATFSAEPLPAAIALGVGAIAVAFQVGQRLQRDTEGLV